MMAAESVPWKIDDTAGSVPWKIDDTNTPSAPAKALPKTLADDFKAGVGNVMAAPELVSNMLTSGFGQAVGGYAGLLGSLLPGDAGQGARWSENVSRALTYDPQTNAGKTAVDLLGKGFNYVNEKVGDVGEAVGGSGGRTIAENIIPVATTVAPVPKVLKSFRENPKITTRQPAYGFPAEDGRIIHGDDVRFARENAAKLEAHELAQKHGIATDPSLTNPTRTNRAAVAQATPEGVAIKTATHNEPKWNQVIASDPDIDIRAPLSLDNIRARRSRAAESSEKIAQTGQMYPTEGQLADIENLRTRPTIGGKPAAHKINTLVNDALDTFTSQTDSGPYGKGMPAGDVLKNISILREEARGLFKSGLLEDTAAAKTNLKIANILEDMVDTHVSGMADANPYGGFRELGDAYRADRRTMAKTYAMEDAFDANNNRIDPSAIAKVTSGDNAMTGHFADVGKIAGVFPESAELGARLKPLSNVHLSRYSIPGVVGSGIGGVLGMAGGPAAAIGGAGMGGLVGAGAGEILSNVLRNRVVKPGVQARGVNPVPRSMWDLSDVDPLGPRRQYGDLNVRRDFTGNVDPLGPQIPGPPSGPQLPGPTQYGVPDINRRPNFQFADEQPPPPPPRAPGTDIVPSTPMTPEQQFRQTKENFANQDRVRYERESAMDALAQQKAEAEAAALRKPTKGGVVIGGESPPVVKVLEGVNPTALERAVEKLSKGQQFKMTAEEKIAWAKAKANIEVLRKGKER